MMEGFKYETGTVSLIYGSHDIQLWQMVPSRTPFMTSVAPFAIRMSPDIDPVSLSTLGVSLLHPSNEHFHLGLLTYFIITELE